MAKYCLFLAINPRSALVHRESLIFCAGIAQLVEQLLRKQLARSSSLLGGSDIIIIYLLIILCCSPGTIYLP